MSQRSLPTPTTVWPSNLLAIFVSCLGVGVLYANFDPTSAGADPDEFDSSSIQIPDIRVPLPIDPATAVTEDAGYDGVGLSAPDPSDRKEAGHEPQLQHEQHTASEPNARELTGRFALLMKVLLLEAGQRFLSGQHSYQAKFSRRERVRGELRSAEVIRMKIRHKPFSLYMKWLVGDKGREVLYVDGENDCQMIVKLGGLKGRLLPALNLDPCGSRAMAESRHPVTKAGILALTKELLAKRWIDVERDTNVRCCMTTDHQLEERPCYCFVTEWENATVSELYRKSTLLIDKAFSIPVALQSYTWDADGELLSDEELDKRTLIEDYAYTDFQSDLPLTAAAFNRNNAEYRLRR